MADTQVDTNGGSITYPIGAALENRASNSSPSGYNSNWYTRWVTQSNVPTPSPVSTIRPNSQGLIGPEQPSWMTKKPYEYAAEYAAGAARPWLAVMGYMAEGLENYFSAASEESKRPYGDVLQLENYFASEMEAQEKTPGYSKTPVESTWQTSIPLFDNKGFVVGYDVKSRAEGWSSSRPTNIPKGKYPQPITGPGGQTIGYQLIDLKVPVMPSITIASPTVDDLRIMQQAGQSLEGGMGTSLAVEQPYDMASYAAGMGRATEQTLMMNIDALEKSRPHRIYLAAVETYGEPIIAQDGLGNEVLDWSPLAPEYLGLPKGYVRYKNPPRPGPNASTEQWERYYQALQTKDISVPLYREDSILPTLEGLGRKGVTDLQRRLVAAGLYNDDTVFIPGFIGQTEIDFMRDIMTYANQNAVDWEYATDVVIQANKDKLARDAAAAAAAGGGGGGGGGTQVYTQTQYTQTSMAQGRSLLVNVLRDALGRQPTEDEVRRFIQMLNAAESKSPMVSTTTTTREGDRTSAVTRMTPSGVDPTLMAEEFAQDIGGGAPYMENQANRYMDALMQSLGG